MKITISITLIFVFLISCKNSENEEQFKNVEIDFCNAQLKIPKTFKKSSFNKLKIFLLTSDLPNNYIQSEIGKMDNMKSVGINSIIFVDSTNWLNNILFIEGEYVKLNKNLSQQYLGMLEEQIKKESQKSGILFDRIESKYFGGTNSQLLKLKYQVSFEENKKFSTQYLISSKTQTLSIIVNHINQDFENNIKEIKIK